MSLENAVAGHYTSEGLTQRIIDAAELNEALPSRNHTEKLYPLDNFHIGGIKATTYFADLLGITDSMKLLDIGAGIGGPARYIASTYGCIVDALDLTPDFIQTAHDLNKLTELDGLITPVIDSALDMPYEDASFDMAYMMHVGMNIEDKEALFKEAYRVLKPGGIFAIYDIMAATDNTELAFPVPWANTEETSFVISPETIKEQLQQTGFDLVTEEDRYDFALSALERMKAENDQRQNVLRGNSDFPVKVTKLHENVKNRRCWPRIIITKKT